MVTEREEKRGGRTRRKERITKKKGREMIEEGQYIRVKEIYNPLSL